MTTPTLDEQIAVVRRCIELKFGGFMGAQTEHFQSSLRAVLANLEAQKARPLALGDIPGRVLNDCGPVEYVAQTADDEREAMIRAKYRGLKGDMPPFGDIITLLHLLDSARLVLTVTQANFAQAQRELEAAKATLDDEEASSLDSVALIGRLRAEIARLKSAIPNYGMEAMKSGVRLAEALKAPPGADAMEIARKAIEEGREEAARIDEGWPLDKYLIPAVSRAIEAAEARGRAAGREQAAQYVYENCNVEIDDLSLADAIRALPDREDGR